MPCTLKKRGNFRHLFQCARQRLENARFLSAHIRELEAKAHVDVKRIV